MERLPSLSVLALAYNEEENVRWAIPRLVAACEAVADDYEIVFITHPQSTDRTHEAIDEVRTLNPRVRYVDQPPGVRGYGPAFAFGLRQLVKEYAFHVDIDGQFPFDDLPRAVALLQSSGADVVHFNRRHRKDPLERKIIGLAFKLMVHAMYRCPVWDFDSAYNVFRTSLLRDVRIASTSGMAVPELFVRIGVNGARIRSGWVEHQPRRAGTPAWEVPSTGIILPDRGIVLANLRDIWGLRTIRGARFAWLLRRTGA